MGWKLRKDKLRADQETATPPTETMGTDTAFALPPDNDAPVFDMGEPEANALPVFDPGEPEEHAAPVFDLSSPLPQGDAPAADTTPVEDEPVTLPEFAEEDFSTFLTHTIADASDTAGALYAPDAAPVDVQDASDAPAAAVFAPDTPDENEPPRTVFALDAAPVFAPADQAPVFAPEPPVFAPEPDTAPEPVFAMPPPTQEAEAPQIEAPQEETEAPRDGAETVPAPGDALSAFAPYQPDQLSAAPESLAPQTAPEPDAPAFAMLPEMPAFAPADPPDAFASRETVAPGLVMSETETGLPRVAPFVLDLPASAAKPDVETHTLLLRLGNLSATYPLVKDVITIGRPDSIIQSYPDVEIELDDGVSRRHAEVRHQADGYYLVDVGSTNGTILNGQLLKANQPMRLAHGDRIRVGERTEIVFE